MMEAQAARWSANLSLRASSPSRKRRKRAKARRKMATRRRRKRSPASSGPRSRPACPIRASSPSSSTRSGRVPPFNFIGQTWPDVLQWLASISNCSLDWQELPNDYLNLTTQKSYPLDEVRDLINRHLHARGYTLSGRRRRAERLQDRKDRPQPRAAGHGRRTLRPQALRLRESLVRAAGGHGSRQGQGRRQAGARPARQSLSAGRHEATPGDRRGRQPADW